MMVNVTMFTAKAQDWLTEDGIIYSTTLWPVLTVHVRLMYYQ
jgi:hypothetical protein